MCKKNRQTSFSSLSVILIALLLLANGGCGGVKIVRIPIPIPTFGLGSKKTVASQSSQRTTRKGDTIGEASWYGRKFQGRKTANGERYNMYAMTAAHPTLPFGTKVRVTNLENGKSAVVRINDRGPFKNGRIIDVSRAAARRLDFEIDGTTQVKLEVL